MPFKSGKLPMRYLGVPLLAKKLRVNDFKFLVDKVASRVNSWRNKVLSYVRRIQLIDLVLSSMQVYWTSVYMFPLIVIKEIDMLLKSFIPRTTVYDARFKDDAKLAHLIEDAQWIWPKEWSDKFHVLTNVKPPTL
ncbi:hypothetical protein Tco_0706388 [Tanacetum coccineum]|uniref:Uncharacterized protein n=1 Tax=Tanacetum coccineum TaxID=301880 RepID=A0ABQ4Y863_9ASTR